MRVIRTFHPIGQGAFYTERFFQNEKSEPCFVMVYDCGASKKGVIEAEITRIFKKGDVIDIVFISHFDADHVKGLYKLLKHCQVKKICIPLLTDIEKVVTLFKLKYRKSKVFNFIIGLIIDPVKSIKSLDLNYSIKLIIIDKDQADNSQERSEYLLNNKIQNKQKKVITETLRHHYLSPSVFKKWQFIPFNYQQKNEASLRKKFSKQFPAMVKNDQIDIIQFQKEWDSNNPTIRKEFKKLYDESGGSNNNSMVVYSGTNKHYSKKLSKIGCLYMGDYNAQDNFQELHNEYKKLWDEILIIQVPHHGAKDNNHFDLYSASNFAIISANPNHKRYKHPSEDVVKDIILRQNICFIVTEEASSKICFEIVS